MWWLTGWISNRVVARGEYGISSFKGNYSISSAIKHIYKLTGRSLNTIYIRNTSIIDGTICIMRAFAVHVCNNIPPLIHPLLVLRYAHTKTTYFTTLKLLYMLPNNEHYSRSTYSCIIYSYAVSMIIVAIIALYNTNF